MATELKPPPAFVKNPWAWAYTLNKLRTKGQLDEGGNPVNYGAAVAIYKRVEAKYGDELGPADVASVVTPELTRAEILALDAPVWIVSHGMAFSADDEANRRLFLQTEWAYTDPAGTGEDLATPLFYWRCEVVRDAATASLVPSSNKSNFETVSVTLDSAMWLVRESPQAVAFVVAQTMNALDELRSRMHTEPASTSLIATKIEEFETALR